LDNRKEKIVEPGTSWERGEGWTKVVSLIQVARQRDWSEWTPEQKERIFHRVMEGVAQKDERRRMVRAKARAFAAGAVTVLVVGLLLRLIGVDVVALALARG
jgi:hypothetical protein